MIIRNNRRRYFKMLGCAVYIKTAFVKETFVSTVQEMMTEGYQLCYIEENGQSCCCHRFQVRSIFIQLANIFISTIFPPYPKVVAKDMEACCWIMLLNWQKKRICMRNA
jgi:hypothetical protein